MLFKNRFDAGSKLAQRLLHYADKPHVLILALPGGGVPVAFEVAKTLNVPLDIVVVKQLWVPGHEELALGATAIGGTVVLNDKVIAQLQLSKESIYELLQAQLAETLRYEELYRCVCPARSLEGQDVIIVDDGLATGASMRAAALAIKPQKPAHITVAVPVAAHQTLAELRDVVDEAISFATPAPFSSISPWYDDFAPTSDQEVQRLLMLSSMSEAKTEQRQLKLLPASHS